jgi:hypothetical protein
MKWERKDKTPPPTPPPLEAHGMRKGRINLSVEEENGNRRWKYFGLTFSSYSGDSIEECLKTWPPEAFAEARKQIDEFEAEWKKQCEEP